MTAVRRGPTPLEEAFSFFLLDRRALPASHRTLELYQDTIGRFLRWLRENYPDVTDFAGLTAVEVREFRAWLAERPGLRGRGHLQPETLQMVDRNLRTFFRWSLEEGYQVHPRILSLPRVRIPWKEPTLFHVRQVEELLRACDDSRPHEALMVKLMVGSGVRRAELAGLCVVGPDGLPDLMADSLSHGVAELRVRGDAGAKGQRSRRVPITPKLALAMKRYKARHRTRSNRPELILKPSGLPYGIWGIDETMRRLSLKVGYRVHAHAFRHTFATVATQLGWNFERLRAAMGHSDYTTLQRYVRLATERDLGRLEDWLEYVALPPQPQMLPSLPHVIQLRRRAS